MKVQKIYDSKGGMQSRNQKGSDQAEGGKKGKKYSKKNHQETKLAKKKNETVYDQIC